MKCAKCGVRLSQTAAGLAYGASIDGRLVHLECLGLAPAGSQLRADNDDELPLSPPTLPALVLPNPVTRDEE